MSLVIVQVPGTPVAKGRPRFTRKGRPYTPEKTQTAEQALGYIMKQACPEPLTGPLKLGVTFAFPAPKRWSKAKREAIDEGAEPYYVGRPDLDNLIKLVKDSGNHILWEDDAQIVDIEAVKVYSAEPGTVINLEAITPGEGA